ncbi:MAG: hypothetical protein A3C07_02285 [Candidatus Sungbacteria bacterium RIFCSPHIGHO2_02_FULL_47_11]|uniref:alanine--tRNA ligase n=1 Tax=Candidatus Sungbacteria bacterium RIFCSPHIGHO2_02_FULL_47_11 TaxID=1802270 RepID=A0A1G2KNM1_9BACT|nr:MAG: hypothetical protein A3C07_02285 [Candidatus Sungbacteria bacterium RIFCSPHIGHO2_02_FULL_47_11]
MQQFKKYYTGEVYPLSTIHPNLGVPLGSKNAVSIQKSFRTSDIDEVGDESHLTFFEMLGNFSFGGYFKKEAIAYAHEFITSELGLKIDYVSIFGGEGEVPADTESEKIWRGVDSGIEVKRFGRKDNFWGPTGEEGPCGPTTEIYLNGVEVWNIVFNEYYQKPDGTLEKLKTPGVDTGMGLERLAMVVQKKRNIFETDLFLPIINAISDDNARAKRIITDHIKSSVFLISEGVAPSNTERGYILRRLLRRGIRYGRHLNLPPNFLTPLAGKVLEIYKDVYPELLLKENEVLTVIQGEEKRFAQSLVEGMKILQKLLAQKKAIEASIFYKIMDLADKQEMFREIYQGRKTADAEFNKLGIQLSQGDFEKATIFGREAFDLYQNYGFPLEMIIELAQEGHLIVDVESFRDEIKKHQEISRAGQERKFGGHGLLLDTGELKAANEEELKIATRLHTATHLLQAALRHVLGPEVHQQGSDITVKRTRFDFTYSRKLTDEEIKTIENLVNEAVRRDLTMEFKEMLYDEAVKTGALYFVREKYPPRVRVYTAYDQKTGDVFSKELCGGPHVSHTGEVGTFRIVKEESSSAGVRRIRAVVE